MYTIDMTNQFVHILIKGHVCISKQYLVWACVFALVCNIDFHVSLLFYILLFSYKVNNEKYKTPGVA